MGRDRRDWAAEETDHPREVIEAALAHVVQNKVEAPARLQVAPGGEDVHVHAAVPLAEAGAASADNGGAAASHHSAGRGNGGEAPSRGPAGLRQAGGSKGERRAPSPAQCGTLGKLAPDIYTSGASFSREPFPSFVSW